MESITVRKDDLIKTLKENREAHRETFLAAQSRYRMAMIEELDRALDEARRGKTIKRAFALPVPEDHTDDFDTVIQMLEWDTAENVELSHYEFKQYVQNEWGWRASFAMNTQSYLGES